MTFDLFSRETIEVAGGRVAIRRAGLGPVVLLLHGFPETHLAWRKVAPSLSDEFTVIVADLPGYGDSTLSSDVFDDGRISKRIMARILADLMTALRVPEFAVVGHDRGARVAYRLALDHPDRVRALAVLDVISILDMAERLTYDAAREMGHWLWLAQPSTVPEGLIGLAPDLYLRHIIDQWGGAGNVEAEAIEEYSRCLRKPEVLRTMGAEYRADMLDLDHDRADRHAGRRIECPVLVAWAQGGLVERFGDPLAVWRGWADHVSGGALAAGHFLMEQSPQPLVAMLRPFLASVRVGSHAS